LDGAHNVAGAEALAATLKSDFASERVALVLGVLQDKDWTGMCRILAPVAQRILLVPAPSERSAAPRELAEICRVANRAAPVLPCTSLSEALSAAARDPFVVIAGSLYLVGEAFELLALVPAADRDERGLNEWTVGSVVKPLEKKT
jgi:dihydrofolate synthase/folylpolyglutamate synthase